jgi:hypothetical protein
MSSTSLEPRPVALRPSDLLRPLGAFEELFCLFDQCFPTNGALAAQIIGRTTVQRWRDALDAVQQRHPLLSARIDTTFNRVPHFRRVTGQRIPLRVITSPDAQWQREITEEVNAPFTPDQAPLFRAVLLYQKTHCIFILSSHHAVCDGSSRIFLLRDMLLALSGHALESLPLAPSREILFGAQQRTSTESGLPSFAARRPVVPHVEGIKLAQEETAELQRRAREEGVTIHAAISAAVTIAGRSIDESWRNNPLRIMSPAEIRDILGLRDQCMVSFGGGEISIAPGGSMTFWELARFSKDSLSGVRSAENISKMIDPQANRIQRTGHGHQSRPSAVRQHLRPPKTRNPLGAMCTPWHRRRADPRSRHRQRIAAPHAHQSHANPRPARGYERRTPESLRDLTQFQIVTSEKNTNTT